MKAGNFSIGSDVWPGLSKLTEECGEVLQILGKLIATGGMVNHWDGTDLREEIAKELADLTAACLFFAKVNNLESEEFDARILNKIQKFSQWHCEQG